ncbi:unnamed protein product [Victoria cruziana]
MIEEDNKEKMQRSHEASLLCLQKKVFDCKLQGTGNAGEGPPPELKNETGRILTAENPLSSRTSGVATDGYSRPAYQQNFFAWSNFQNEYQKLQHCQWQAFQESYFYPVNREYPFPLESNIQCMPYWMQPLGYPQDFQFQEFQYFVVIDFEATCDKEKNPHPQEIIEFPSVLVNSMTGQLEGYFQTYVRPAYHQHLTDFCKELTGIQQIQVDRGVPLSEALLMHDKWLEDNGIKHTNFAVVTWSNWDCRVMLESECRFKRIRKPPYFNRWINLRVPFHEVFGDVRCNLKEAVQLAGLAWEGRAHCGLDDARNTARLLTNLMRRGLRFSITDSLVWQMPGHSPPWQSLECSSLNYQKMKQPSTIFQFHPSVDLNREKRIYCYCGVKSVKRMIRKPGPKQGSFFFGCGNWSATRGAVCPYFEWAS